mmetsp:Transcript_6519/g.11991  ORF Transcript_6519/g.11991 Transcript_6519/m.11991 type:complete len:201 (-) Transcript_6519:115-717(-)
MKMQSKCFQFRLFCVNLTLKLCRQLLFLNRLEAPCDFSCCPCARYSYPYYYTNSSSCSPCSSWRNSYVEPEYYGSCSSYASDTCGYYGSPSYIHLRSPYRIYPTLSYNRAYHGNSRWLSSLYFPPTTSHFVYANTFDPYYTNSNYYGRSSYGNYGYGGRYGYYHHRDNKDAPQGSPPAGNRAPIPQQHSAVVNHNDEFEQ